ncbi:hypothetical protein [Streptomyces albidoflavus]|uniref:hypothetical protein n=1 Tax=Streptomyces albidoflavus TaxID=1886 RepID=UPI0034532007
MHAVALDEDAVNASQHIEVRAVVELDQGVHGDRVRERPFPVRGQPEVGQSRVGPVLLADFGRHLLGQPLPYVVGSVLL